MRKINFGSATETGDKSDSDATPENSPLSRKPPSRLSIAYQNPSSKWKERIKFAFFFSPNISIGFALTYESFIGVINKVAAVWVDVVDLNAVYNSMLQTSQSKKFYVNEFFILLILFAKLTLNQKLSLVFDLTAGLNTVFSNSEGWLAL